jgi:hypothetical protein
MPNTFQTIAQGVGILKQYYQGPIVDQFNNEMPIYRGAEKGKHKWSGLQVQRPLKLKRHTGIGAVSDGGNLPSVGTAEVQQATIAAKFNYLRFGISGPMIKASQGDVGSFVRSAAYLLEEGYKDLKSDVNRQLSWDGTGWLARLSANVVSSNVLTIAGREATEDADKFLDTGMSVDIVTAGGTIVASGLDIVSITGSGLSATVTLSGNVTASSGDYLIRAGSNNNEMQGLLTALDGGTSTIYGINRAVYRQYQGNSLNANGSQLTLDLMQQAYNLGLRRGGAKYSAIYCDFDSLRMYQKLLTADKRYVNTVKGDGGFAEKDKTFLDFNGIPVVADKDCPTRIFFLDDTAIEKYVLAELEFSDETGSMMIAQVAADLFEVRLRLFANLFNAKPAACAVLRNYISP